VTSSGVVSDNLSLSSFVIDTYAPTLLPVTIASNNSITTMAKSDDIITLSITSSEAIETPIVHIAGQAATESGGNMTWSAVYPMASVDSDNVSVSLNISFSDLAYNAGDNVTTTTDGSAVWFDRTPPTVREETAVPNPTNDNTPDYTFSSNEAGTITYGGACGSSSSSSASSGNNNTVTLTQPDNSTPLNDGTYDNCTITVTDNATNESSAHAVQGLEFDNSSGTTRNYFTIGATKPALLEITPVSPQTKDTTPDYTFFSTLSGTINYGGSCSSDNSSAVGEDNNTITFRKPSGGGLDEGTYTSDNCTISVTSNNVVSDNLSLSSFVIDTNDPTLLPVTIASNNSITTMAKTGDIITLSITSSEAIQAPSVSIAGQTATVTGDNMTWSAAYTMQSSDSEGPVSLNIGFSDLAGNAGIAVTSTTNGSAVLFDRTNPTLGAVSEFTTPSADNRTSYTFSSTEAGTITYSVCSGSPDNASAGNNPITFDALADGTYSNCKISVTDNASNTSDNLSVRSFTIGAITPALAEVTPVETPDNDTTPSYTFFSTLPGTITYGVCSGSPDNASADNNTITFDALADGTYSNCKISVDNNSNTSDNLSVSSFYDRHHSTDSCRDNSGTLFDKRQLHPVHIQFQRRGNDQHRRRLQ